MLTRPVKTVSGSGGGGVTNPLTANLDFAQYKAIAMACDNGSTVPSTPAVGQWFLHTPTGRKILYCYDGLDWQTSSIISFGSMTVYVNGASGTDSINKGFGTGTDAFATVDYARSVIPSTVIRGDVTINVASGTYTENIVFRGVNFVGDYQLIVKGAVTTLVSNNTADIFSGTTIGKSGAGWTVNTYAKKMVRIVSGTGTGQVAIIKSNTSDTLTIYPPAWKTTDNEYFGVTALGVTPNGTSVFTIEDWATTITASTTNGKTIMIDGQIGLRLDSLKIQSTASSGSPKIVHAVNGAVASVWACSISDSGSNVNGVNAEEFPTIYLRSSIIDGMSNQGVAVGSLASFKGMGSVIINGSNRGINIHSIALVTLRGNFIDNNSSDGIKISRNSVVGFGNAAIRNIISNNGGWGVISEMGGIGRWASYSTFSGNASGTYTPANMTGEPGGND